MAGRKQRKVTTTKWKLSKLRDHPRQAEMFGDIDDGELKALAESADIRATPVLFGTITVVPESNT